MTERAATACGVALLGVLSLDCGGTFCDEYPEACGGSTAFDVEVSLLDGSGQPVPAVPVLVSDLSGKFVETTLTGIVTLPGESYVSLFYDGSHAFTALVTQDIPKLSFKLPAVANPPTDIEITATCGVGECLADTQLSASCSAPVAMLADGGNVQGVLADYAGCAGIGDYDAFLVGYDESGLAERASSSKRTDLMSQSLAMPTMTTVDPGERFDFEMTLVDSPDFEGVTRAVRVPHSDHAGYGFSRVSTAMDPTIGFSLVTEFVPRAQALFVVSLGDERALLRQQLLDPVPAETSFVVSDLATPAHPPPLQQGDPGRPKAYYELDEGRLGDALQLTVEQATLRWVVSIPADAKGSFSFPELPAELSSYLLDDPDDYDVLHVDLDAADAYAAFVAEPILDYAADSGTADLTIARNSR